VIGLFLGELLDADEVVNFRTTKNPSAGRRGSLLSIRTISCDDTSQVELMITHAAEWCIHEFRRVANYMSRLVLMLRDPEGKFVIRPDFNHRTMVTVVES